MDMSGNAIAKHDSRKIPLDSTAFAALAAGDFAAVDAMVKLVGGVVRLKVAETIKAIH